MLPYVAIGSRHFFTLLGYRRSSTRKRSLRSEMLFQKFAPFFNSQELETMTAAYNEAWPRLTQTSSIPAHRLSEVKAKLEHVILAAACSEKRDKELLETWRSQQSLAEAISIT